MGSPSLVIAIYSLNEAQLAILCSELASSYGIPVQIFMDSRTSREELDFLSEAGVTFRLAVNNTENIPEGIYRDMSRQIASEWLWILNPDEWPSQDLVDIVLASIRKAPKNINAIGFARRWVRFSRYGKLVYSRFPRMLRGDYQWRIIRHKHVVFRPIVHTPGFEFSRDKTLRLPIRHVVYHFDWIVHSLSVRRNKVEFYEGLQVGAKKRFAAYYLPEDREWVHFFRRLRRQEVTHVARRMQSLASDRGWADQFRS